LKGKGEREKVRKNLFWISLITLLILSVLSGLSVNTIRVSAVEYPAIMVVPESTWNETLTPGMNYTISIYTDYNGSDVWSYQFTLSYNPNVLHGGINKTDTWTGDGVKTIFYTTQKPIVPDSERVYVNETLMTRDVDYIIKYDIGGIKFTTAPGSGEEIKAIYLYDGVVNGDLITKVKHPDAMFDAGTFNNTLGRLKLTVAWFYYEAKPVPITSGPGTLANVTFTVVGYGTSNITIGDETKLIGWTEGGMGDMYDIIDAKYEPEHIQHGFFSNKILGDVDGDRTVDASDLFDLSKAYGSELGDPNWTPDCDFNKDNKVDASDLFDLSKNYGRSI